MDVGKIMTRTTGLSYPGSLKEAHGEEPMGQECDPDLCPSPGSHSSHTHFNEVDGKQLNCSSFILNSHKLVSRGRMWGLSMSFSEQTRLKAPPSKGVRNGVVVPGQHPTPGVVPAPDVPQSSFLVLGGHPPAAPVLCSQLAAAQYIPHGHGHCGLLPAPREW